MILRKPYAFLIKNFKLIHLLLTILLCYIFYKTNNLLQFFNEYISSKKYPVIYDLVNDYIGILPYVVIFIIIGISFIIFWLMNKKDKPIKYYLIVIVYYIVLIAGLVFASTQLNNIGFNKIDVLLLNLVRDVLLVLDIAQIPLIIVSIVRTVGFNIKKFNFQRDLLELQIEKEDNEEFELDVDIDSLDVKTRFKRRKRIIKYVLKENKLALITITGILLIVVGLIFYNTIYKNNFTYKENSTFDSNGIRMTVLNSYQLDEDFFGNDLSKGKYSYTVIRIKVKNISNVERTLGIKTFSLKTKSNIYYSSTKEKDSFIPLGITSESIKLSINEEKVFIVIFKIDKKYENSKKILEYAGSYKMNGNERVYNIDRIRLDTKKVLEKETIKTAVIGEKLVFNDTILNNTSITINSYEIKDKYLYTYKQCTTECYTFNDYIVPKYNTKQDITIMKLDLNIDIDSSLYNDKLKDNLISSTGHIRYIVNGTEKTQKFNLYDITPSNIKDYKYFEVKGEVRDASHIYLDFIILDKVYTYKLKES